MKQNNNRIVVDYGGAEKLVMLACIDNATGIEEEIHSISTYKENFELSKKYDGVKHLQDLLKKQEQNKEGFVIKFKNGFRLKIKFAEYCRLHKILTQTSNISIWEYLKTGKPFDELLEKIPDEFYSFVRKTRDDLLAQYAAIENEAKKAIELLNNQKDNAYNKSANKKEQAFFFRSHKHWDVIFELIKDKHSGKINKADELIWKKIRPTFAKPFMDNADAE